jgi:hypothetical protein
MSTVTMDKRIQTSMDRLRAMGIKFYVEQPDRNQAYVVIDMDSLVKLIDSKITYPSRKTTLEKMGEKVYMMIHFWRGELIVES